MSAQHTPGPICRVSDHELSLYGEWDEDGEIGVTQSTVLRFGQDGECAVVIAQMDFPNTWNDAEHEANVCLFEAAPGLLDAANAVDQLIRQREDELGVISDEMAAVVAKVRAAIAKAHGEQA